MKIRETFEYEVDTENIDDVFTIKDYVDCVDDMPCPFWDGYHSINITKRNIEILENNLITNKQ